MPKEKPIPSTNTPDVGATFAATVAQNALSMMVEVVAEMDAPGIAASLQQMRHDPEHVINMTNETGELNWTQFEAGGPLYPEHIEIRLGAAAKNVTDQDALIGLLRQYEDAPLQPVAKTTWGWLCWWRPPGLPPCIVGLLPFHGADQGVSAHITIGAQNLKEHTTAANPELMHKALVAASGPRLSRWLLENEKQPLSAHPGFDIFVQKPAAGLPGVCAVRMPTMPFVPPLALETWDKRYGVNVFETVEELAAFERFYETPGAAFSRTPPFVRNRPPPTYRPASLVGGIVEGRVMLAQTPWPDARCIWVWTLPNAIIQMLSPEVRSGLHRGRYMTGICRDVAQARAEIDRVTRGLPRGQDVIVVQATQHPRAALPWQAVSSGRRRHVVVGDALEGRDPCMLFLLHQLKLSASDDPTSSPQPTVLVAAEDGGELASAIEGHIQTLLCKPADVGEILSGPHAPGIGFVVFDHDAAAFAAAALPMRDPSAPEPPLAAVIWHTAMHRDVRDVAHLETAASLAAKTGANLALLLIGEGGQGPERSEFDVAVASLTAVLGEGFKVVTQSPAPSIPLRDLAAEILCKK